jgi:N-acetylglutamate synthase-like GNAT family acetyltransferase
MAPPPVYAARHATAADLPALEALMRRSIDGLLPGFLPPEAVAASHDFMGVDSQLVRDGTYFVVEAGGTAVGCGGWSRRATLFGGDHAAGREARSLRPEDEPARVRAMYTDPAHVRRGIGRHLLALCEAAAASEGFGALALMATAAGEPLYHAAGFTVEERVAVPTRTGVAVPCARMCRPIGSDLPSPLERHARALLTAAGLPTQDLTPAHFAPASGDATPGGSDDSATVCMAGHCTAPHGVVVMEWRGAAALLRSLVVDPAHRGAGTGRALVEAAEALAACRGVEMVVLLTTTAAPWFAALGYRPMARGALPGAIAASPQVSGVCPASAAVMAKVITPGGGAGHR